MNRPKAIKFIYHAIRDFGYGLARAVEIYEYLSGGGVMPVTDDMIFLYLINSGFYRDNDIV